MNTPMIAGFRMPDGVNMKEFARVTSPLGAAEPEEVAGVIAYIASDSGRYMTGSIVSIDGGITA
jgi:NAD(P)-dependent dehydrogenase (short-subunit alcohol dehydrogenase family)